ncbi:2-isopropylmalate synthase [Methanofollis fontis]|uniref:Putative (R)-citramalate synthase CimA n=1 Tax=Methanofollis fontis TaxID=2052832 RepID=A0A483CTA8_9EURY|nr:2-isopropylmalate synthase [Methanofollis fontis]TAJ43914.1 2-isopropylmalate synthase [Methanofollis fontis]
MIALFVDKIRFFDTTLRDGEQTPGVSLKPDQKVEIASMLSDLGVATVEAGSAAASDGERTALRMIADAGLSAEVATFVRALPLDIDHAADNGADCVHLVVPVSDLHISAKLRKRREDVMEMALTAVEYAKERGLVVELSGEDASRADPAYLADLFREGVERGADRLCYCDTVGILTPERVAEAVPPLLFAPLSIHCHDDLGMALTNTLAALKAGASSAHVTVNGLGERAGNTPLEEMVMALETLYGVDTGVRTEGLYALSAAVSKMTGVPLPVNKAIVGEMAFTHESGIHAHGVLRNASTYEPIRPEQVGRTRRILLGKHSGSASVRAALQELGYACTDAQVGEIVSRVKIIGDEGRRVTDADLMAVADAVMEIVRHPVITLKQVTVISGSNVIPTASVTLTVKDEEVTCAATGNGPVDAAVEALRRAVSDVAAIRLEDYRVDAITGGTDALVDVSVCLSREGRMITSHGARTDIIMGSVEAMVSGMNRLLEEKR